MKAVPMSFDEVMSQLEAAGTPKVREINRRQGADENQFGVMFGTLRALAKKIKTDHVLALQLWQSGNLDARLLASMIMDAGQLSAEALEAMLREVTWLRLFDEFCFNVAARHPQAEELRERWTHDDNEYLARAGWNMLISAVGEDTSEGEAYSAVLDRMDAELKDTPAIAQEAMNRCMVEIATHFPAHTARAIAIGEKYGRLDDKPVPKGCTSSYAPDWIAAVLKRKQ